MNEPGVVIGASGRFHYGALAQGLHGLGRLTRYYTGLPRCTGVPRALVCSDPWVQVPLQVLLRLGVLRWGPGAWPLARLAQVRLDEAMARTLPDCGIFSALSGCGVKSLAQAKGRGIRTVCERGSTHIRVQEQVWAEECARWGVRHVGIDPLMIEREEAEYREAQRIVVLSEVSRRSFVQQGVAADKIRVVPARATPLPRVARVVTSEFRVLFVGVLSLGKGVGYLAEGFRRAGLPGARLVLVGARAPETPRLLAGLDPDRVERTGPLSPLGVAGEMARASVLVLPSVDDGQGVVLLEAMGMGLPVIASALAGGSERVRHGVDGYVVAPRDGEAIAACLRALYEDRALLAGMGRQAGDNALVRESVTAYAARWLAAVEGD